MRCNDRVAVGSRPTVFVLHCYIVLLLLTSEEDALTLGENRNQSMNRSKH